LLSIINRDYTALAILLFERERLRQRESRRDHTRVDKRPSAHSLRRGVRRGERAEDDEETTIVWHDDWNMTEEERGKEGW
jgi:hypothetical protein